jgi:hypothetical protein
MEIDGGGRGVEGGLGQEGEE